MNPELKVTSCVEAQKQLNAAIHRFNAACEKGSATVEEIRELLAAWKLVKEILEPCG